MGHNVNGKLRQINEFEFSFGENISISFHEDFEKSENFWKVLYVKIKIKLS